MEIEILKLSADSPPERGLFGLSEIEGPTLPRGWRRMKVEVTSDGAGLVSHAGGALLT